MNDAVILPSIRYKRKVVYFSISMLVITAACIYLQFNPFEVFTNLEYLQDLLAKCFRLILVCCGKHHRYLKQ